MGSKCEVRLLAEASLRECGLTVPGEDGGWAPIYSDTKKSSQRVKFGGYNIEHAATMRRLRNRFMAKTDLCCRVYNHYNALCFKIYINR